MGRRCTLAIARARTRGVERMLNSYPARDVPRSGKSKLIELIRRGKGAGRKCPFISRKGISISDRIHRCHNVDSIVHRSVTTFLCH